MTRTKSTYDGLGQLHRRLVCGAALGGALALTVALTPALASEPVTGDLAAPATATQTVVPGQPAVEHAADDAPIAPETSSPEVNSEPAAPTADTAEKPAWLQGENLHITASPTEEGGAVFAGQTVTVSVTLDADNPDELPGLADVSLPGSAGLEPIGPVAQDGATFSREFLVTDGVPVGSYLEISVLISETDTHAESTALDITTLHRAQLADYTAYFEVRNSIDEDQLLLDYQSPGADELLEYIAGLDGDEMFLNLPAEDQDIVDLYTWTLQHLIDELVPKTHVTLDIVTRPGGVAPGGVLDVYVKVRGLGDDEELPLAKDNIVILAAIDEENPLPYADDSDGPIRIADPNTGEVGYLVSFNVPDDAPLGSAIEIEATMLGDAHTSDGIVTASVPVAVADVSALQEAVAQAVELIYGQDGTDFTAESREALRDVYLTNLDMLSGLSEGLFVMPEAPEDVDAINAGLARLSGAFQPKIDLIVKDLHSAMNSLVFDTGVIIAPQAKVYDGTATFSDVVLAGIPGTTLGDAGRISGVAQVSSADAGTYAEVVIPRSELAVSGDNADQLWEELDAITDEDGLIRASDVSFTIEKAEPRLSISMPSQVTAGEAFQVGVTMGAPASDPDGMGLPTPEQMSIAVDGATGDGVITKEGHTYVATFTAGNDAAGATLTATARVLDGATNYAAGGDATVTAAVKAAPEQPAKPDEGDKEPQPDRPTPGDNKKDEPKKEQLPKTGDESLSPAVAIGIAAGGVALAGAGAALIARSRRKDSEA
ncbi:MAG: LPXTG cell wall anchor domain-containing protein [Coriobacteriia bacterium]|nr:LPXTG cell wall anchor domain-containing protein [Coriobacteriia bacterium]MBS5477781.1 LPXTG cell wall anchor domain-containing protein [Coriobacteriia bacterium]